MRTSQGWWCDTKGHEDYPGCEEHAAIVWLCKVEGREVSLCNICNRRWRERAKLEPELAPRCPLCRAIPPVTLPARPHVAGHVLAGPIADVIKDALYREGILVDVQARVLRRLGNDGTIQACEEFITMWHENRAAIHESMGANT